MKQKTEKSKPSHSIFSNYRFVYSSMWKYDKSLVWYGIAEVIFNVLMPFGSVLIPSIVIGLLVKKAAVLNFAATLAIVFIVYGIVTGIRSYLVSRNKMQYIKLRVNKFWLDICNKCISMDYYLMENEKVREDMEKASDTLGSNYDGMEGFMHSNVSLATNLLGVIAYACIISTVHPLILLLLLLISITQMLTFRRAKNYEHSKKEELTKIWVTQRYLQEQGFDVKAGKDIRLYQLDKLMDRVYNKVNQERKKIKSKIMGTFFVNDMVGIVLRFLRDAVCYGYLIYLLIHGLEVSYFVLYLGVVSGFAAWFTKITEDISQISREHLMICDFRSFMEKEDVFQHKGGKVIPASEQALDIVFDHVTFRYDGAEQNILEDISLHIRKGEKFALVGINGAGKTTMVKLMCGFYQPTKGRILINGIDTRELNIEKYFEQIAVVFQDPFTLSFTLGENISGSVKTDIDYDRMKNAIQLSGLRSKVDNLDKGIDTFLNKDIDESGIQLSGGELQKLMLARAIYKNAKLIILDEPTAALDSIAESELYEQYQKLLKGRTSLFISHRLASTRFCNHIILLKQGRIAEEGSHDALMKLNGEYANMFHVQSRYYKEEDDEVKENLA